MDTAINPGNRSLFATARLHLDWWTFDSPIGTKDTAVTGMGTQQRLAAVALIVELAGVGRHYFLFGISAARTCQHRFQDWRMTSHKQIQLSDMLVSFVMPPLFLIS